jgi:hypothetical protein
MHPVDPVNPVKYHGLFYTTGQFNFYSTTQIETVTINESLSLQGRKLFKQSESNMIL